MENDLLLICKKIAERRKELKYSQSKLAEMVGTTQQHIANFEAGKVNISMNTVLTILDALALQIDISPLYIKKK